LIATLGTDRYGAGSWVVATVHELTLPIDAPQSGITTGAPVTERGAQAPSDRHPARRTPHS
jgi:hypothetical protein